MRALRAAPAAVLLLVAIAASPQASAASATIEIGLIPDCIPAVAADLCPGMHEGCMGIHVFWHIIPKAPQCLGEGGDP